MGEEDKKPEAPRQYRDDKMSFSRMGYFNTVVYNTEPEEMKSLFTDPEMGDEELMDNVEHAIQFINDMMDADMFYGKKDGEVGVGELVMKGFALERIRFEVLREDWMPVFDPFPVPGKSLVRYYDPDINPQLRSVKIRVEREETGKKVREIARVVDRDEFDLGPDKSRFLATWRNYEAEGDTVFEAADNLHELLLEESVPEKITDQVAEKFVKLIQEMGREREDYSDEELGVNQLRNAAETEE